MEEEKQVSLVCAGIVLSTILKRRRRSRKNRRIWIKEWLKNRQSQGVYHNLLKELEMGDNITYSNFVRMDVETFYLLLDMVIPYISHKDTHMRPAVSPGERLAVTLRYLATGESFKSLQYQYRISESTIGKIIPETCYALKTVLEKYLQCPQTEKQWEDIALGFEERWNFNNCVGALDGKHVLIKPPAGSGSYYYNYKHSFSVVLLALVDADYKFIYVDIGCNGRISDGGVLKNSTLGKSMEDGLMNFPNPKPLAQSENQIPMPFVMVADDAFPLKEHMMKPYGMKNLSDERRIFNYRLSRARRIVENAFGILSNRFRVFMSPIALAPEKVETIVLAATSLHNFLRTRENTCALYIPNNYSDHENSAHDIVAGSWRGGPENRGLLPLAQQGTNNYTTDAKKVRDLFCEYFNSPEGAVPWQWDKI